MFVDFKENIELLEKVILNFVLTADDNDIIIKPKNMDALTKGEMLGFVKSTYFSDENHQEVYRTAKDFYKEHEKLPSRREIKEMLALKNSFITSSDVDQIFNVNLAEYSYPFLYKYTKSFVIYKNFNSSITGIIADLKTQDITPDNIDSIVNKTRDDLSSKLNVTFSTAGDGLDFFEAESHVQPLKSGTPSGFNFIDKVLDGGWNPKTLVVFQGRPKVGKSLVLANMAVRAVLRGVNTGVATFELSAEAYTKRIGANMLNIPYKEYNDMTSKESTAKVAAKLKRLKEINPNIGALNVKEFGTGAASALDVENYFLALEQRTGKKFKIIVLDYLNIMRPINPKEGMYEKIKVMSEEIRAVAIRNEWTIITATQVKREAVSDNDLGMEDVAESFGLIHTVDTLFGLMRGPLEKVMKIKVIANRDGGYTESYQRYDINYDYARLTEGTGPADVFYSDEDQAADLKQELVSQYNAANTSMNELDFGIEFDAPTNAEGKKLIPMSQAEAKFANKEVPSHTLDDLEEPVLEDEFKKRKDEKFNELVAKGYDEVDAREHIEATMEEDNFPFDADPPGSPIYEFVDKIEGKNKPKPVVVDEDPFADIPTVQQAQTAVNHDVDYDDLLNSI